jgi:hypothetical protein
MKIRLVGVELFQVDGGRDRQTDTRKPTVAFRNFTSAPKKMRISKEFFWKYVPVIFVNFHFHLIFIFIFPANMTNLEDNRSFETTVTQLKICDFSEESFKRFEAI